MNVISSQTQQKAALTGPSVSNLRTMSAPGVKPCIGDRSCRYADGLGTQVSRGQHGYQVF